MDIHGKAKALLTDRDVDVLRADSTGIWAMVRGTSTWHKVKLENRAGVAFGTCDCPYPKEDCAHVLALKRIWTVKETT